MYKFLNFYKLDIKFLFLIGLNFILACPALIYVFSLESIFFKSGVANKEFDLIQSLNFSNKILMISSIIMFYIIPFYFSKLFQFNWIRFDNLIISLIIFFICVTFFNYSGNYSGGGIFLKFHIFLLEIIFYFIFFYNFSNNNN